MKVIRHYRSRLFVTLMFAKLVYASLEVYTEMHCMILTINVLYDFNYKKVLLPHGQT
jgi:hypothetical protein